VNKVNPGGIEEIHTKIKGGSHALLTGVVMSILVVFCAIVMLIVYNADASFEDPLGKYVVMAVIFFPSLGFLITSLVFIWRGFKHKAIVRLLFASGLLTRGSVAEARMKHLNKHWWQHKLTYTYIDDKGSEYTEKIVFITLGPREYMPKERITIAFCNGISAMVVLR